MWCRSRDDFLLNGRSRATARIAPTFPFLMKEVSMKIYKGRYMFLVLAIVLLFMSACSPSIGGNGGSSLTPLQVLQNSAKTMQKLKSAHFQMTTNATVQTGTPATPTAATPTNNISLNVTANGDEN